MKWMVPLILALAVWLLTARVVSNHRKGHALTILYYEILRRLRVAAPSRQAVSAPQALGSQEHFTSKTDEQSLPRGDSAVRWDIGRRARFYEDKAGGLFTRARQRRSGSQKHRAETNSKRTTIQSLRLRRYSLENKCESALSLELSATPK